MTVEVKGKKKSTSVNTILSGGQRFHSVSLRVCLLNVSFQSRRGLRREEKGKRQVKAFLLSKSTSHAQLLITNNCHQLLGFLSLFNCTAQRNIYRPLFHFSAVFPRPSRSKKI